MNSAAVVRGCRASQPRRSLRTIPLQTMSTDIILFVSGMFSWVISSRCQWNALRLAFGHPELFHSVSMTGQKSHLRRNRLSQRSADYIHFSETEGSTDLICPLISTFLLSPHPVYLYYYLAHMIPWRLQTQVAHKPITNKTNRTAHETNAVVRHAILFRKSRPPLNRDIIH